jgi:MYXO-CTERM domain-containing protein
MRRPIDFEVMKRFLALLSLAPVLLAATPSFALTEPTNPPLQIPIDSKPQNNELQLYDLFSQRGDPVDWQADAGTQPATFSPLCSFSATFVMNQAGSHFGLAWYNATGSPPPASDLHVIFPPNTPVGTVVTSNVIQNDPAYQGGLVGFALVGGQTHYSEQQWDPVCTGCSPPQPWISALIYASKNTPNAFYVAFEDGTMGPNPTDFSNDGDFNDDVFFLTGLTCAGGGQPCDTGKPGICAAGLTACTANGVVCQQLNQPQPKETCNGVDDDCNGMVDDGNDLCQPGFVCDKGTCVKKCGTAEFVCAGDTVCDQGFCVVKACKGVTCDSGKVCVDGTCKAPCDGVVCPYPQVCRVGACVDPCAGVSCGASQVCQDGVCVASCNCAPCPASTACDSGSGQCVDPSCVGVSCDAGKHCVSGTCKDDCDGAMCPSGETCKHGNCVASTGSGGGMASSGAFGVGGDNSGSSNGGNGPGNGGANVGGAFGNGGGGNGNSGSSGGCGCRVGDDGSSSLAALAFAAGLALLAARRRED